MASCSYCGRSISPNAKTCPGCGEPDPAPNPLAYGCVIIIALGIGAILFLKMIGLVVNWVSDYKTEIMLVLIACGVVGLGYALWRQKKSKNPSGLNHENEALEPDFGSASSETTLKKEKAAETSVKANNKQIRVPYLGEDVQFATITHWLRKVGDHVEEEESVVVIETDKVTIEIHAPSRGVIDEVYYPKGSKVTVGDIICKLR